MKNLSLLTLSAIICAACSPPTELAGENTNRERPGGFFRLVNLTAKAVTYKIEVLPTPSQAPAGIALPFARYRDGAFPVKVGDKDLDLSISKGATSVYLLPQRQVVTISGEAAFPQDMAGASIQVVNLLDKPVRAEAGGYAGEVSAASAGPVQQIAAGGSTVKVTLPNGKVISEIAKVEAGISYVVIVHPDEKSTKVSVIGATRQEALPATLGQSST